MKVLYSISATLMGGGIGNTAYYGAEGLWRHDVLGRILAQHYNKGRIPRNFVRTNRFIKFLDLALGFSRTRIWRRIPHYRITDTLFDMWAARKVKKCDIFHYWMTHGTRQRKKARRLGATIVVECASSHPSNQREILKDEYKKWGVPFKLEHEHQYKKGLQDLADADYVKIPSEYVRDSFLARGFPEEKLIQIPFGVDASRFTPKKDYGRGKFTAVFVGSVGIRKGVQYLLQAWEELALKNAKLYIVGALLDEVEHILRKYETDSTIEFTGHTNPTPILQKSDIFVFPSLEEGSALVTYEAMATGLPCIVTHNSGSLVRNGKDGFIVPAQETEKLKEKILWCYNNRKKLEAMGKGARVHIKQYTWERHGDKYYEALEAIHRKKLKAKNSG